MEEPSAPSLEDPHQDGNYSVSRWKCKWPCPFNSLRQYSKTREKLFGSNSSEIVLFDGKSNSFTNSNSSPHWLKEEMAFRSVRLLVKNNCFFLCVCSFQRLSGRWSKNSNRLHGSMKISTKNINSAMNWGWASVLQSVLVLRLFVIGVKGYRQATFLFTNTPRTIDAFFLFVSSSFFAFHDNFLACFSPLYRLLICSFSRSSNRKADTNRRLNCPLIDFASDANEWSPSIDGGTFAITEKLN